MVLGSCECLIMMWLNRERRFAGVLDLLQSADTRRQSSEIVLLFMGVGRPRPNMARTISAFVSRLLKVFVENDQLAGSQMSGFMTLEP